MKRNPLFFTALIFSKIALLLLGLALPLVIGFFVHWHIAPDNYQAIQISAQGGAIALHEDSRPLRTASDEQLPGSPVQDTRPSTTPCGKRYYLNELTAASVYTTFMQVVLSIVLSLMMVREVRRILQEVSNANVFTLSNSKSFRALGWMCFSMSALNSIRIMAVPPGTGQDYGISFNPGVSLLLFMLASFIMAEIFKEGHNLSERDRLTI